MVIRCDQCGAHVSHKDATCQHCGAVPVKKEEKEKLFRCKSCKGYLRNPGRCMHCGDADPLYASKIDQYREWSAILKSLWTFLIMWGLFVVVYFTTDFPISVDLVLMLVPFLPRRIGAYYEEKMDELWLMQQALKTQPQ